MCLITWMQMNVLPLQAFAGSEVTPHPPAPKNHVNSQQTAANRHGSMLMIAQPDETLALSREAEQKQRVDTQKSK